MTADFLKPEVINRLTRFDAPSVIGLFTHYRDKDYDIVCENVTSAASNIRDLVRQRNALIKLNPSKKWEYHTQFDEVVGKIADQLIKSRALKPIEF